MFDPYHKWLGIPPGKRPATLYQLLAIAEGEKDRDVIEAAAVRQSAYVRNFQKGPNSDLATRLLEEIADARQTLLDPVRRRAYDEKLAAEKPKPVAAPRSPQPAAPAVVVRTAPVAKPAVAAKPAVRMRSSRRRSSSGAPLLIILGVASVAVASGVGVYFATRGGSQPVADAADGAKLRDSNPATVPNQMGSPNTGETKEAEKAPFNWDQVKVDRPNPPPDPNAFRPPVGPPQGFGPPPGFGRPPNFGGPQRPGPPFGFGRGAPPSVAANGQQSAPDSAPPKTDQKNNEPKEEELGGVEGALAQLRKAGFFDIDKASKYLTLVKPDPERHEEVAKAINDLLVGDSHLPDTIYDAAAVWANADTVKIIADKLAVRPFVSNGAIRAAGKMRNPKLAHPLCVLLEDFFSWKEATRALQQMGPAAEDRVKVLLNHRDPKMRAQACLILASIGTEKSLPALKKAIGDRNTSTAAKAAIQEVTERVNEKKAAEEKEFE